MTESNGSAVGAQVSGTSAGKDTKDIKEPLTDQLKARVNGLMGLPYSPTFGFGLHPNLPQTCAS